MEFVRLQSISEPSVDLMDSALEAVVQLIAVVKPLVQHSIRSVSLPWSAPSLSRICVSKLT